MDNFNELVTRILQEQLDLNGEDQLVTEVMVIYQSTSKEVEGEDRIGFLNRVGVLDSMMMGMLKWAMVRLEAKVFQQVLQRPSEDQ